MSHFTYKNTRPVLVVESMGGSHLGNCYSASYYKVTSTYPICKKTLLQLRDAHIIANGQEFYCKLVTASGERVPVVEELDWRNKIEPTGKDIVPCVEVNERTGEVLNTNPVNKYTGKPYGTTEYGYYVYEVETRVDSSD